MTERYYIFSHGFACTSAFWARLVPYFPPESCIFLERGYLGKALDLEVDFFIGKSVVGIGHSLGLHRLITLGVEYEALIGLNAFLSFLGYSPSLMKRRKAALRKLIHQFQHSPQEALSSFYCQASLVHYFDQELLSAELVSMLHADLLSLYIEIEMPSMPVLFIGSDDDKIVSPEVLEEHHNQYPDLAIVKTHNASHTLGWSKVEYVYNSMMYFLERLEK